MGMERKEKEKNGRKTAKRQTPKYLNIFISTELYSNMNSKHRCDNKFTSLKSVLTTVLEARYKTEPSLTI
jgi:hypothetical protein